MAAYGGLNHVQFSCGGEISVRPVILPATRLNEFNDHLMLFYTGIIRTASQVAASFVNDFESRKRTLRIMQDLVNECLELLCSNRDISHVGKLLHETWQLKRSLSGAISNTEVDDIYNLARKQGAIGGKLLGAGGGGFMLLFVPPERQVAVREALGSLLHVPFSFENNGSQIIFYDVEEDYAKQDVARSSQSLTAFRELKLEGDGEAVGT